MKKFLSILAAVGLASTAAISVVACENNKIIQAETVNKTADDLVLAPDHQSATLKLNQVEALKLELVVQESENKYVNGINLPASDQAVVVNGTNIIATFTPNLESGIVMVVLKADKAITVPEVTFVFGDGNAKLSIANLNLDFIPRQIIRKSAILGADHQSATLKLNASETITLGLMKLGDSGHYQFGKNYPYPTNGVLTTTLNNGTSVQAQIDLSADGTGTIKLTSDQPMNGNSNVGLTIGDCVLMIDYNVVKDAVMASDHQSATLKLNASETITLGLMKLGDSGHYQFGKNYPYPTNGVLTTTLDNGTSVQAQIDLSADGTGTIKLTSDQPMNAGSVIVFLFGDYILMININ